MATVDIHYIQAALNCAARQGIGINTVLDEIGVSQERLQQNTGRVHGDLMTQLVQKIWTELGDEFMGCTAQRCKPGAFAFMARNSLHYDTLEAVLRQSIQFYNLFTDDIQMKLRQKDNLVEFEMQFSQPELDPDFFFQEFWMIIWHRYASWLIGKSIPLHRADFSYAKPLHQPELKHLFPCRHHFNQPCLSFSFSAKFLSYPPIRTQRDLSQFLKYSPADLITIPGDEPDYKTRIRVLLLQQDDEVLQCPSLEILAQGFNISSQTLRRKLKSEGSSYPQIKDEIRRDLAVEKLYTQKLKISEIAHALGYSESRSFTRAFKLWTGLTPTGYLLSKNHRS